MRFCRILALTAMLVVTGGLTSTGRASEEEPRTVSVQISVISNSVLSSEISGAVKRVVAREGSAYRAGEVLVELDCRAHEALANSARAAEKYAQMLVENLRRLSDMKSTSNLELAEAENNLAQRRSEHLLARLDIEHCSIRAPFDGGVISVDASIGEYLIVGDPVLRIVASGQFEAQLLVSSIDAGAYRVGQKVHARIYETGNLVGIRLARVGPVVDPVSRTIKIYGMLINPPPKIKPGMTGVVVGRGTKD